MRDKRIEEMEGLKRKLRRLEVLLKWMQVVGRRPWPGREPRRTGRKRGCTPPQHLVLVRIMCK